INTAARIPRLRRFFNDLTGAHEVGVRTEDAIDVRAELVLRRQLRRQSGGQVGDGDVVDARTAVPVKRLGHDLRVRRATPGAEEPQSVLEYRTGHPRVQITRVANRVLLGQSARTQFVRVVVGLPLAFQVAKEPATMQLVSAVTRDEVGAQTADADIGRVRARLVADLLHRRVVGIPGLTDDEGVGRDAV